jgi:hypothetical protein
MEWMEAPLASLSCSPTKRIVIALIGLSVGGLIVYSAMTSASHSIIFKAALLLGGVITLLITLRTYQALGQSIFLTEQGLFLDSGQKLVAIEEVESVNRSAFAFKPSNGFVIVTRQSGQTGWAPGLWWRVGRSLGIGGSTPPAEGKFMADKINELIQGDGDV